MNVQQERELLLDLGVRRRSASLKTWIARVSGRNIVPETLRKELRARRAAGGAARAKAWAGSLIG
jgi:hypothetical protein